MDRFIDAAVRFLSLIAMALTIIPSLCPHLRLHPTTLEFVSYAYPGPTVILFMRLTQVQFTQRVQPHVTSQFPKSSAPYSHMSRVIRTFPSQAPLAALPHMAATCIPTVFHGSLPAPERVPSPTLLSPEPIGSPPDF
jgi:hypothetical protein